MTLDSPRGTSVEILRRLFSTDLTHLAQQDKAIARQPRMSLEICRRRSSAIRSWEEGAFATRP